MRVGDAGVLASQVLEFPNGGLVSRSLDNRIGAFVVLEALRLLASERPAARVTAAATTREEIGRTGGGARTGAAGLEADVAIVVDVTHATDYPGVEKRKHGDYKLGGGPVLARGASINPVVFDLLVETAEAERIPYSHRGRAAGHQHRRRQHLHGAQGRGHRPGLGAAPLHAQPQRDGGAGGSGADRAAAGRLLPAGERRRPISCRG